TPRPSKLSTSTAGGFGPCLVCSTAAEPDGVVITGTVAGAATPCASGALSSLRAVPDRAGRVVPDRPDRALPGDALRDASGAATSKATARRTETVAVVPAVKRIALPATTATIARTRGFCVRFIEPLRYDG